jgi:hypothetical protein
MKCVLALLVLYFFVVGCKLEDGLSLSRNSKENRAALQEYVPPETPSERAISMMTTAGFSCEIKKNETLTLSKGSTPIGTAGKLDFVQCTKNDGKTEWDVLLFLDQEGRVKDLTVSSKPSQ